MLKRIVVLLLFVQFSFGQVKEGIELCFEYKRAVSAFTSDKEANEALDKILSVIGASKNFTLTPCDNIFNALAVTYKGERHILYDGEFMKKISEITNDWSSTFILAHEVGHHINGHTRDFLLANVLDNTKTLEDRRKEELEADKFAGFVLAKLGASLNQTIAAINLMASNSDDRYSTHPNKTKRIEAIREGYSGGVTRVASNKSSSNNSPRTSSSVSGYWTKERVESSPFSDGSEPSNRAYVFGKLNPIKNNFSQPKLSIERYNKPHSTERLRYFWKSYSDKDQLADIDNRLLYVLKISNLKINTFGQLTSYDNRTNDWPCMYVDQPCPDYITIEFVFDDQSKLSTNNPRTSLLYGRRIQPVIKRSRKNWNQITEVSFHFYKKSLDDGIGQVMLSDYKRYGYTRFADYPFNGQDNVYGIVEPPSEYSGSIWDEYLINYLKTKSKVFVKITVPDQNDEHKSEYFEFSLSGSTKALDFLIPHGNNVPGSRFNKF